MNYFKFNKPKQNESLGDEKMLSSISILYIGLTITTALYAIFSIILKKPLGLYIAAVLHIILSFKALPSIGLYVLGVAIIEVFIGVQMTIKHRRQSKSLS